MRPVVRVAILWMFVVALVLFWRGPEWLALDEMGRAETNPLLGQLSQAEIRGAEAVSAGMTNREAAAALYLSVKTVDFHLQQIYRKLGVRSRTELAVMILGDDRRAQRRAG